MYAKIFLLCCAAFAVSTANGRVGCLFSSNMCYYSAQWCYDDYAFGQCLSNDSPPDADFYRYHLGVDALTLLEQELGHLYELDYRWGHSYTQCIVKAVLGALRYDVPYVRGVCEPWREDPSPLVPILEMDPNDMDPNDMAYVKFTPSVGSAHPDFADEVYFPPEVIEEPTEDNDVGLEDGRSIDYNFLTKKSLSASSPRRSPLMSHLLPPSGIFSPLYNTPDKFRSGLEVRDNNLLKQQVAEMEYNSPAFGVDGGEGVENIEQLEQELLKEPQVPKEQNFIPEYNVPEDGGQGFPEEQEEEMTLAHILKLNRANEIPPAPGSADVYETGRVNPSQRLSPKLGRLAGLLYAPREGAVRGAGYTEGGLVRIPEDQDTLGVADDETALRSEGADIDDGLDALLLGFKRPERLDVKKPGPLFTALNLAEQHKQADGLSTDLPSTSSDSKNQLETPTSAQGTHARSVAGDHAHLESDQYDVVDTSYAYVTFKKSIRSWQEGRHIVGAMAQLLGLPYDALSEVRVDHNEVTFKVLPNPLGLNASEVAKRIEDIKIDLGDQTRLEVTSSGVGGKRVVAERKELHPPDIGHAHSEGGQYDVVDTTYAYITFKNSVKSWQEGKKIVRAVAQLLGLPSSALSQERVDRNEVTFKVLPNPLGMNASEVAKRIEDIKVTLKERKGVVVTSAGIGDKAKLPTVLSMDQDTDNNLYIIMLFLSGAIGGVLIGAVSYFFIRRNTKSREKLQALPRQDPEASKDYQELCRARMSTKASQEKPEPIGTRIASLSRESEGSNNSPSSRSSTSSWSEEPAHTNMDISTGHMVLSYMEDHLKNKDRLEREWVALCAYEAEPCATTHALKPENIKKNRFNNVLPFDHSRVVLNDLANISGSDYINASTITDHDPRNPAYIATQGALPHTAADFWQLVWEQGSVVMVMLTRLTENGVAMCHRYWPEEGSELYHIYEVHLVSEHIWCDDYLVRSFYLKNLKTGETRTVTQFHFLSWPDNGVPQTTKALLEFRRKVNKSYRGRSCPIVVHCSDGVGRTGTYCVIDMVLNRMAKGAKEIDIAATLEHIRDQRANMVKTKQQFEFVLTAVAEEVNAILKALPAQLPPASVQPVPVAQAPATGPQ